MYTFLALFNGFLICIMILLNGTLAGQAGLYYSLLITNSLSFLLVLIAFIVKKASIKEILSLPKYLYIVGFISILNITLNNISFINLGATLTVGLVLYGQFLSSLIVDFGGFLGMKKQKFHPKKLIGIAIMSLGILVMILF